MTIPAGSTGPQIASLERTFNSELKEWITYQNVDQAVKKQLLVAVDPIYYRGLCNRYTGYSTTTTRQTLDHLYTEYGEVGPDDMKENEKRLK